MNVHLTYSSGHNYSAHLADFQVTITRKNPKRVSFSFREKDKGQPYAAFSLPTNKARQFAHAILASASADDSNPIEFMVNESEIAQQSK